MAMPDGTNHHNAARKERPLVFLAVDHPLPAAFLRTPMGVGSRFKFGGDSAPWFFHKYDKPTAKEIFGARNNPIRLALVPAGDHTSFVLIHCPGMLKGWADLPFAWLMNAPQDRMRPTDTPSETGNPRGYFAQMMLLDERNIVRALRSFSMTPEFTSLLDEETRRHERSAGWFSVAAHDAEIGAAYARWPTAELMVRHAIIVENVGIPFK